MFTRIAYFLLLAPTAIFTFIFAALVYPWAWTPQYIKNGFWRTMNEIMNDLFEDFARDIAA